MSLNIDLKIWITGSFFQFLANATRSPKKKEHHYWIILKSCTPLWNTVHASVHSFSHSHSVFTTSRRDKQELVTNSGEEKKKKKSEKVQALTSW